MENQVMEALLSLMAQHGYQEGQFNEFIQEYVRGQDSIITVEYKNGIAKFEVVKPEDVRVVGDVTRTSWDFNVPLELEHLEYMKKDFDRFHPNVDSKWVLAPGGMAMAYYPSYVARRVKDRKQGKGRQGGSFINDTYFRKNNNSRRGY